MSLSGAEGRRENAGNRADKERRKGVGGEDSERERLR